MSHIAIVYFSGYGHTKKQAEAVHAGAASVDGAKSQLIAISPEGSIADSDWETLAAADAIIFGSPTYMGNVAWQFKKFADASSKPWFTQQWKNKLAGGFTNSASINGDKLQTLNTLITLAMQHGMLWVGNDLMPSNKKSSQRNDPNWLASFSGAMAQSPSDSSPEEGPLPGDLDTSRHYGQRIAEWAVRLGSRPV